MRFFSILVFALALLPWSARAADADSDGLQDEWELLYFPTLSGQSGSDASDLDLLNNMQEQSAGTDPTLSDSDGDGLNDDVELAHQPALDPLNRDTDGDSLTDSQEGPLGTDPTKADTDGDGLNDFIEHAKGFNPKLADTDGGGLWDGQEVLVDGTDPLDPTDDKLDSDDDGIFNYWEGQMATNPFASDTDGDWLSDGQEDADLDGVWEPADKETSPTLADTDGDGLSDGWEVLVYGTDPFKTDSDADGLTDGHEHDLRFGTYECLDPRETDSDRDGLSDGDEITLYLSDPCNPDSDVDGLLDASEVHDGTALMDSMSSAVDQDLDGLSDAFEGAVSHSNPAVADTDGDGLSDSQEWLPLVDGFLTSPVDADTDDDGILDGSEGGVLAKGLLTQGSSPVAIDSDGDGLTDGLERGLTAPQESPLDPDATDLSLFAADSNPASKTSPTGFDTDQDGLSDGFEDTNHNGAWDADETNPLWLDTDGDGIDDGWETQFSSPEACAQATLGPLDPLDPADGPLDNDADGLTNFQEYTLKRWEIDSFINNSTNPCKPDTDDDSLKDGAEVYAKYGSPGPGGMGSDPNHSDTDADGLTDGIEDADHNGIWSPNNETNPVRKDTDSDGLADGWEDADSDGFLDTTETDPKIPDTDSDGLTDGQEVNQTGTNPLKPDTDQDGLFDGLEVGSVADVCPENRTDPLAQDTDGDGLADGQEDVNADGCFEPGNGETNPLSADSDGDKLSDGLEVGAGADQDPSTHTDPLLKDSDGDGLWDSHEDLDKDGRVDPTESDPNKMDTDTGGVDDGTEVLQDGTSPTDPKDDSTADPDQDGLINSVELLLGTDRYDADSDHDTIPDGYEVGPDPAQPHNTDGTEPIDALDTDSDGDGIPDSLEAGDPNLATEPVDHDLDGSPDFRDLDSDEDGISDQLEWSVDANLDGESDPDADLDNKPNFLDDNSDNDARLDADEGVDDDDQDGIPNFVDPDDTDGPVSDSDGDGILNQDEETLGTDPFNPDTDSDELWDKAELETNTDPLDQDSDDDGVLDGLEAPSDTDGDRLTGPRDPDSDDDGLFDGTETGVAEAIEPFTYVGHNLTEYSILGTDLAAGNFEADTDPATTTSPTLPDSDNDGWDDGAEDPDHNGAVNSGESNPVDPEEPTGWSADLLEFLLDTDDDGLTDLEEFHSGSNPDDADSDDDGLPDGREHNWRNDSDRDGLANFSDADGDNDGLADGLEEGVTLEKLSPDTRLSSPNLVLDVDPESTTGSLLVDSDGDLVRDGLEDLNHNGSLDASESDPNSASSFAAESPKDSDGDGLPDVEESSVGCDPERVDTDDDGIWDGIEPNWAVDSDQDGLVGALDPDSDNDGLADGTEVGLAQANSQGPGATQFDRGNFQPDMDPTTTTNPLLKDSDGDGLSDGSEDTDKNGRMDSGENNPLMGEEEALFCADSDEDGLCDNEESLFGASSSDADSDEDGLMDGLEDNWRFDTDGDGVANVLDPDSDQDLLFDGTEAGVAQAPPGTDLAAGFFRADLDPQSQTFMVVSDSDHGGAADGLEDANLDGMSNPGETDPNDRSDDNEVDPDIDGDGLPNAQELTLGTNPLDADSDGDTIRDDVEVGSTPDKPLDTDGDGTIDALDLDSDGDSILDADEAGDDNLESPPADSDQDGTADFRDLDSDDDGLEDREEVQEYHTDPTLADTDEGGANDFLETRIHRSDPLDPRDDFVGWLEEGAKVQGGPGCSGTPILPQEPWPMVWLLVSGVALLLLRRNVRRRISRVGVLSIAAMLFAPSLTKADFHPDAKYTYIDANPFRLDPDGTGIINVFTDEVPGHFGFLVGGSLHYVDSSARVVRNDDALRELMPYRLEFQVSGVLGLWGFLEVGAHLPATLYQESQYAGYGLGSAGTAGMGNAEVFAKIRLLDSRTDRMGVALVMPLALPTATDTGYMGTQGFAWHPRVTAGKRVGRFAYSINLGYLLQERHTLFALLDNDKLTTSLGLQFDLLGDERLVVQTATHVAVRAGGPFEYREEILAEANAAVKVRLGSFVITLGGGKGLSEGFGTPDFRIFSQVMFDKKPFIDLDRDRDGIQNAVDTCPDQAEDPDQFEDLDGCPDPDNDLDRIPDGGDTCPNQPEDWDRFKDEDGCPDPDNDADQVLDEVDRCPLDPEDRDNFQDEDGCPDPDNDADGVPDAKDMCPDKKETFNDYKDDDGCPDKKLAEMQSAERRIQIHQKIHFKFMSAELDPNSYETLDQVAQILQETPDVLLVQVEGHTDRQGSKSFNLELSMDRASSVVKHLVSKGVDRKRLKPVGFGFSRRIDYRTGREANTNNRRVEFNVIEMRGALPNDPDSGPGTEPEGR